MCEKPNPSGFTFIFLPALRDLSSIQITAVAGQLALELKRDEGVLLLTPLPLGPLLVHPPLLPQCLLAGT